MSRRLWKAEGATPVGGTVSPSRQPEFAEVRDRARELRKNQTPAEQALWDLLRGRQFRHLKFRRQVPIGPFITDFYCHRLNLVIELDGEVHADPRQVAHDENRDIYLRSLRLRVLRFPNRRLLEEPEAVMREILAVVG